MPPSIVDPFDHSYENEPVNDLIASMKYAVEKQKVHIAFQGMLPEWVTPADKLTELIQQLEAVRDAALSGAPALLAEQSALMAKCAKALRLNSHHVLMLSQHRNDPSIQQEAGYKFKHVVGKVKVNLLDQVPELLLRHGEAIEAVNIIIKRAKPRASVEVQMTETPNDEQSWRGVGEGTYSKSRVERRGLESAKRVFFRARYHEDGATGHWSSPVSIIVL